MKFSKKIWIPSGIVLFFSAWQIIVSSSYTIAQNLDLDWVVHLNGGSSTGDVLYDMVTDDQNNVYITGTFSGNCDFDPGPGTNILSASTASNAFIAKYTSDKQLIWVKKLGGTNTSGHSIAVDANYNVFVSGRFAGPVDFDPGPGTNNISAVGSYDIFTIKLSETGDLIWVNCLGGTDQDLFGDMYLSETGSIIVTGSFRATVDLDPGVGTQSVTSLGGYDTYLQVFNSDGSLDWAHQLGGMEWDYGNAVIQDSLNNIYLAARNWLAVDYDPGPGTAILGDYSGIYGCLAKYDVDGNFIWVKSIGFTADVEELTFDSNHDIVMCGRFSNLVDFDLGPGTYEVDAGEIADVFYGKYTLDGDLIWVKFHSVIGNSTVGKMILDGNDYLYFAGAYLIPTDLDPGPDTLLLDPLPSNDGYLLVLDSLGNFNSVIHIGNNSGPVTFMAVAINNNSEIIIGGSFTSITDFNPAGGVYNLTGGSPSDAFFMKLTDCITPPDPVPTTVYANLNICYGETTTITASHLGTLAWYDSITGGSLIHFGNTYNTPILYSDTTFYVQDSTCASSLNRIPVSINVFDLPNVVANAIPSDDLCADQELTLFGSGAYAYNWTSGIIDSIEFMPLDSTTFIVEGIDTNGCINNDTIFITVHDTFFSMIELNGYTLQSLVSGDSYQWVDCLDNFNAIIGATDSIFAPLQNGYYALELTINGCADLSSCYQVLGLGQIDSEVNTFSIYPNPTSGTVTFVTSTPGQISIFDPQNKLVYCNQVTGESLLIDLSAVSPGVYYLVYKNENTKYVQKIIINP